ncbi:MAG: arsenate reductase (glutaredoxin) [Myxococcota bacterium]
MPGEVARASGGAASREASLRAQPHAQITLVRHGEPDWTPRGGPSVSDPGLTPLGAAQAAATARRVAAETIDAIYVSPLRRSQETAAALADRVGVEPITVDGFAEVGVAVDGLSQGEVDRYFVEGARRPLTEHWGGWPGAESFHDFHERVTRALEEILAQLGCHPERQQDFTTWRLPEKKPRVAIVAHCGTNAVALTHLLDIRPVPWEWLRFESELAAFSVLQARPIGPDGHVWSLQNFNEVDPLNTEGLRGHGRVAMSRVRIYHNPSCSKSRGALEILRAEGVALEVVEYLDDPPDRATLERLLELLPDPPAGLVRKDKKFRELGLDPDGHRTAEAVVELLLVHPELMQRPVVIRGERALIARPSETVRELL